MNLKSTLPLIALALMTALSLPLCAQTGCVDSPEDPTIVLTVVAGVGALAASIRRMRSSRKC
jgi:XrtJ-associated TM-motif-TM protein